MANTFRLEIVTPDRQVVSVEADELTVPAARGQRGILPSHAPLLATLTAGEVSYRTGQQTKYLAISGGFVEVLPEKTTLLVEAAEKPEEIDVERASTSMERAEKTMATLARKPDSAGVEDVQFKEAEAHLHRAVTRIQVARKSGPTGN